MGLLYIAAFFDIVLILIVIKLLCKKNNKTNNIKMFINQCTQLDLIAKGLKQEVLSIM